jgi:hypothetical protein
MFGALIAMLWLREPSSLSRVAGLATGALRWPRGLQK